MILVLQVKAQDQEGGVADSGYTCKIKSRNKMQVFGVKLV